ncbi:unnamed protein product [Paramecium pentaurelia]|uniref:Uncharacterized protein n=1 Tax=Paramecium pentaurelia TaxID=43138 RepID=A0A8S1UG03_9CILI|nr:unnamed protein product [Paramecium pentaurelia]
MIDYIKETGDILITRSMSSFQQNSDSSPKNLLGSHKQFRFPTISNSLLKSAIEANYLEAEQKNNIIRNPNHLTVFRMHFDTNSPRTQTAMEILKLNVQDLQVKDYEEFYQKLKDPLQNLISYLQYVTGKYKILNDILKKRNQIKHIQSQVSKQINSKNIKYKDESISLEQTTELKKQSCEDVHSTILSATQKKELFDKKLIKASENYNKFLNLVHDQINKQDEYYSKTAPEIYQKAERLKQKQLELVRKKLRMDHIKVDQICQKAKKEEQTQYREHQKIVQELEKDHNLHQERKQKQLQQAQEELLEQLKKKEEKERERQLKRQIQMNLEQSMIDQVMDSIKKKSDYMNEYLHKKQENEKKKHNQTIKIFEEKQKKLQESYVQKENQNVQNYFSKSTQRQIQINKHEISQLKQQKSLSLKNSRIMKRVEQFQESLDQKRFEELNFKLQETDEKLEEGIKRHQSLLDLRKIKLSQKNEHRFKLAKQKQMENMLEKIHKQNQILQKNLEINQKNDKIKQELEFLEKYKKEQLQDHVIQRSILAQKLSS